MIYTEAERQILEFLDWNGRQRFADPLRVRKLLSVHSSAQINGWIKERNDILQMQNAPDGAQARVDQLENLICDVTAKAFGVQPFDPETGTGATDSYLFELFKMFTDYLEKKGNPPANGRTSAPCSGCP